MTTIIQAKCSCGLNAFDLAFATESLPVSSNICHCNACRHLSGQLARNYAPIQGAPVSSSTRTTDLSTLTTYNTTEQVKRWFCSNCSASMFVKHDAMSVWYVSVGILQESDGIVSSKAHIWISDTLDGGFSNHLSTIKGELLPRYSIWPTGEEDNAILPPSWSVMKTKDKPHDRLSMYCHCKTVSFFITRPTSQSTIPSAPYPSLLYPADSTPDSTISNPGDEKWWLRDTDGGTQTRYLAGYCTCTQCTLSSGSEHPSWAFIPRINIGIPSSVADSPEELNLKDQSKRPKGLKQYISSPGTHREFCGTCGANVFLWRDEHDVISIATGLIDQDQDGALAESWLDWHRERVGFARSAIRKTLIEGLEQGLRVYQGLGK